MQIGMYDRVVSGRWLRTALGNWYFLRDGNDRAFLERKVTEHPAPFLVFGRFLKLGKQPGAQVFKGKSKISVII